MRKEIEVIDDILYDIRKEYLDASKKFDNFHSPHEGYAVISEELDELWDEVKGNERKGRMYDEAKQVGAMALRFILDCCKED